MTSETETITSSSEPISSANEQTMRSLAGELNRQRAEDAPAGDASQDAEPEPLSIAEHYQLLRKAVAQIEDHLGITDERDRTLNEAKAKVAELEKLVAAYTAEEDASRPKWAAPQTATILSHDRLVALKR